MEENVKFNLTFEGVKEGNEGGLGTDPVVDMEASIKSDLVERGRHMLHKLIYALDGDNSIRMLRIIENISKHHRELIMAISGGDTFKSKFDENSLFGSGGSLSMATSFSGQEENFGAQALKGIVEGVGKLKPKASNGPEIESLVKALDLASSRMNDHRMQMLATRLETRLTKLLEDEPVDEKKEDDNA